MPHLRYAPICDPRLRVVCDRRRRLFSIRTDDAACLRRVLALSLNRLTRRIDSFRENTLSRIFHPEMTHATKKCLNCAFVSSWCRCTPIVFILLFRNLKTQLSPSLECMCLPRPVIHIWNSAAADD